MNDKGEYTDKAKGIGNHKQLNKNYDSSHVQWKRISSVKPKCKLSNNWEVFTEETIKSSDIEKGEYFDSYFINSITALTVYPYLLFEIFGTKKYNDEGYYELILFIDGKWQIVFVDDWFPFDTRDNSLIFVKPSKNAFWPILIEKAWAKVNGGYSNMICDNS